MDPGEVGRGHAAVGQGVADAAAERVHHVFFGMAIGSPSGGRWLGRPRGCTLHPPAGSPHEQDSAYQSQAKQSISSTVSPSFNDSRLTIRDGLVSTLFLLELGYAVLPIREIGD